MSRRDYPRIGSGPQKPPPPGTPCENCGDAATKRLWIQCSHMRGEDEPMWICDACEDRAWNNLGGFLKSCARRAAMLETNQGETP